MSSTHDYRRLDPLLSAPMRLAALTLLATAERADFTFLRDAIGASDGNLGAHMRKLIDADYVEETKRFERRKPQTTYRVTRLGRSALDRYLAQLHEMLGHAGADE